MFEVKVSAVTRFADRVVGTGTGTGTGTGLAAVSATPTLCADIGDDVHGTQDIGDDVREAQEIGNEVNDVQSDVEADVLSDIGKDVLDAIANFTEEATLVGGLDVADVVGAEGDPAKGVFSESASVGELLRVRKTALVSARNRAERMTRHGRPLPASSSPRGSRVSRVGDWRGGL
ncbi:MULTISPECIES: hypothetical protein [Kitasatospora]|uniref:Uncharacterized protein n=1 Tax=Kitasatospora cystarginea TaxID=58350 RepID=A0ABN3E585_9ACTN